MSPETGSPTDFDRHLIRVMEQEAELEAIELEMLQRDKLGAHPLNTTQWEFINSDAPQTCLSGINQQGKTVGLIFDLVYHTTGKYPEGFKARKEIEPFHGMLAGSTATEVRDYLTDRILGPHDDRGSGFMPEDCIAHIEPRKAGISHQVDYFEVWHHHPETGERNGKTRVYVRSYDQTWRRIRGYPLRRIWLDEEPPFDFWDQASARLNADPLNKRLKIVLSPEMGWTPLFRTFHDDKSGHHRLIPYGVEDCEHLSGKEKDFLYSKYSKHHLKSVRLHGLPTKGEGLIFPFGRDELEIEPFLTPAEWLKIIGLDFPHGVGTLGAAKLVIDEDNDMWYVTSVYKASGLASPVYVSKLKAMGGASIPCAWPHDGNVRLESGEQVKQKYEEANLNMIGISAQSDTGSNSPGPVIEELFDRMQTERIKIFSSCTDLFDEIDSFRSKDGKVVANQDDHIIDALIKAAMMIRYAEPGGSQRRKSANLRALTTPVNFYKPNRHRKGSAGSGRRYGHG